MYIYQNGKLYVQRGNKIVGVDIYPHKIVRLADTETVLEKDHRRFTAFEVQCKFQTNYKPYIFPRQYKPVEVVEVKVEVEKKVVEPKVEKIDLESLTTKQLKQLAKEKGLEGYSRLKKDDLISLLK